MKQVIILAISLLSQFFMEAQTSTKISKYETAMLENIRQIDTASAFTLLQLANNFERIGNIEKEKWEPFYYAAYSYTALAFTTPDKNQIDGLADQADKLIAQAKALEPNSCEITVLEAMSISCRIMVDPVSRFQTKGREVAMLLAKAKQQDVTNPRIYLLEARMQLRTPEAFGGGKHVAKTTIATSLQRFATFKPANNL